MIQFYIWYSNQISFHQSLLKRPAKWKSLKDEQERLGMPSDFQKAFFFSENKDIRITMNWQSRAAKFRPMLGAYGL